MQSIIDNLPMVCALYIAARVIGLMLHFETEARKRHDYLDYERNWPHV
jgi:hypothetical protein